MKAALVTVMAMSACAGAAAFPMVPAEQRGALAKLMVGMALMIAGYVGSQTHEEFGTPMGVAFSIMGATFMTTALADVGQHVLDLNQAAIFLAACGASGLGMTGGMWEACGRGDAA